MRELGVGVSVGCTVDLRNGDGQQLGAVDRRGDVRRFQGFQLGFGDVGVDLHSGNGSRHGFRGLLGCRLSGISDFDLQRRKLRRILALLLCGGIADVNQ